MKTIGDMINYYLRVKDMKPIDLHQRTGVPTGSISNILNNKQTNINTDTLLKIAKGLGVHPGDLMLPSKKIMVNGKTIWLTFVPEWEEKGYTPQKVQEILENLEKLKLL